MVYAGKARPTRGGFAPRPDLNTSYKPLSPLPIETAKVTITRIVDNRLRMLRYWNVRRHDAHIALLRANLVNHIALRKSVAHFTDHAWFDKLDELCKSIDLAQKQTLRSVYAHIEKDYPEHL